ncbi:MAG: YigZ family protein, partial [Eubacteriales bacterium]|nr:YigZ family protein [Eubacteriales bacterium]
MEEKKSRFIAACRPVGTEAEAQAFLSSERGAYPDASHHVYAWITGGVYSHQRYSDDGEPQGTAGMPVLDVLRHQELEQVAVVVTRYFGGTLLGTGGLSRAYGQAAVQAVEAARPVLMRLCREYQVTASYTDHERLSRAWLQAGWRCSGAVFGIDVDIKVQVPLESDDAFRQLCADLTGGAALIEPQRQVYLPLPPPDPPPA